MDLAVDFADLVALRREPDRARAVRYIGRPARLTAQASIAAAAGLAGLRDDLAAHIEAAGEPGRVSAELERWARTAAERHDVAGLLYRPQAMADMAGQLFVRTIEAPDVDGARALDAATPTFLDLPFREAVEFFRARYPEEGESLDGILDAYRRRSDEGAALLVRRLQELARARLDAALAEGETLRDFTVAVRDGTARLGIEPASPSYLEMVFRTQVATSYGAGRVRQIRNPAVMEARPFVEYRTVGDARVRPNHAALDGLQFRSSDTEWLRIAPPNGVQCRCSVVTLDPEDVIDERLRAQIPDEGEPDEGFAGPPTDLVEEPLT